MEGRVGNRIRDEGKWYGRGDEMRGEGVLSTAVPVPFVGCLAYNVLEERERVGFVQSWLWEECLSRVLNFADTLVRVR